MEKSSESGSRLSRLTAYAGPYKWLTYAALAMSAVSAALSVVPYYYIWCILDEVLAAYPDLDSASGIVHNGWMALGFTVLSIAFYIAARAYYKMSGTEAIWTVVLLTSFKRICMSL